MNKKSITVLLPGSYDPPTLGHLSLIERAAKEYASVLAVAFINPKKQYTFSKEERVEMLKRLTAHLPNVSADFYDGLVIDYAKAHGASLLIKGYRNESDLAYEKMQADWNLENGGIKTLLLPAEDGMEKISSTAVRDAIREGKTAEALLSDSISSYIGQILAEEEKKK